MGGETANRLAGDLVDELLRSGAERLSGTVLDRAAALGHDLDGTQMLAVISVDRAVDGAVGGSAAKLADIVRAAAVPAPRPLVGAQDGLLVVILPAEPDPTPTLARLHELVAVRSGSDRVTTVLGAPVTGLDFGAAAAAVELCPEEGTGGGFDLRQLGLAAYLLRTGTTAELRSFADTLVLPLEEHDARRRSRLCETVRVWLAEGTSVPAAAKALIVHPNTVAYRLARAEQLIRRDLRTTATRMELQLAFTVRDIQRASCPV